MTLTYAELQVFELIAIGYQDREIAHIRNVNIETIRTQVKEGRARLGAKTRSHAIYLLSGAPPITFERDP